MRSRDTIAAIATPAGTGGVAIVRVSGPDAGTVAARVFRTRRALESHRMVAGRIVTPEGETIDRGMAVMMCAPRSYTGEDVLELHCHGGALVSRRVLEAALEAGCRAAERGEFTERAFLNGKLDLAQAESVSDLITARTDAARRVASEQLAGRLSEKVEGFRDELVGIAAGLEAQLDFAEEDVGPFDREGLGRRLAFVRERVAGLAGTYAHGRILREGARVAIAGKPNVGKSSLLNRLLETDRAIVTEVPGTTRDVIEETLDLDGWPVVLVDTAGIRSAADPVETIGIDRSRSEIERADLVLVVLDRSGVRDDEDDTILNASRHACRLVVLNKSDLPAQLEGPFDGEPVSVSARTGDGFGVLRHRILDSLGANGQLADSGGVTVTKERHQAALKRAGKALEAAERGLRERLPPDVVAVSVMEALDGLGDIVGYTSAEDVLDRVFREFCIGK